MINWTPLRVAHQLVTHALFSIAMSRSISVTIRLNLSIMFVVFRSAYTCIDFVSTETSILLRHGGCFSADSVVIADDDKPKKMSNVVIGDRLLTLDVTTGKLTYGDVIAFLHRDADVTVDNFVSIETASGHRLTVTSNHVLFASSSAKTDAGDEHQGIFTSDDVTATFAGRLTNSSRVYSTDIDVQKAAEQPEIAVSRIATQNASARSDKVVNVVRMERLKGVYAPLTSTGTLVVNGVVASCYASFASHQVAHMVMAPLRLAYYWNVAHERTETSHEKRRDYNFGIGKGIHWYAASLSKIAEYVIPADCDFWCYH